MNQKAFQTLTALLVMLLGSATSADDGDGDFVRLVAALDEPEFYCLDLAGWVRNLLLDDPLQTHTCKGRGGEDQMFHFADGQLKVSLYDRCVQVAGSSGTTLAGSAVLARPCSDNPLQKLTLEDDGRIRVTGTDFCLAAGTDSTEASGPSHMWRTLTVASCSVGDESLLKWQTGMSN